MQLCVCSHGNVQQWLQMLTILDITVRICINAEASMIMQSVFSMHATLLSDMLVSKCMKYVVSWYLIVVRCHLPYFNTCSYQIEP